MSGDARMIATEGAPGAVRLWDLGMGKELRTFEGHGHPLVSLQFSGDDRYIFTGTREGVIGQWDRVSGECVKRFDGPAGVILFSRDGRVAFMADRERTLLYHMADERVLWSSRSFLTSPAGNLSMSENGLWLLIAEPGERGCQLWSTRQGRLVRTLDTEGRLIRAQTAARHLLPMTISSGSGRLSRTIFPGNAPSLFLQSMNLMYTK